MNWYREVTAGKTVAERLFEVFQTNLSVSDEIYTHHAESLEEALLFTDFIGRYHGTLSLTNDPGNLKVDGETRTIAVQFKIDKETVAGYIPTKAISYNYCALTRFSLRDATRRVGGLTFSENGFYRERDHVKSWSWYENLTVLERIRFLAIFADDLKSLVTEFPSNQQPAFTLRVSGEELENLELRIEYREKPIGDDVKVIFNQ